jgi:hypothetical protein
MNLGLLHAADGFAMAMVVILTLSLGIVALLAAGIYRSSKRRENEEVEKLLEEVRRDLEEEEEAQQPKHPTPPAGAEDREPWEKDVDWWKK